LKVRQRRENVSGFRGQITSPGCGRTAGSWARRGAWRARMGGRVV